MEDDKNKTGLGCPDCGGTCGGATSAAAGGPCPPGVTIEMAKDVYRYLRLGSPRLAFAAACGVPRVPWSFRVEADFTETSQTEVTQAGNDVKIVQDTFIEEIKVQVQNQNTPGGLDSLTNFFFEMESGIEANMKVVGAGTGYMPIPEFTPLKHRPQVLEGPALAPHVQQRRADGLPGHGDAAAVPRERHGHLRGLHLGMAEDHRHDAGGGHQGAEEARLPLRRVRTAVLFLIGRREPWDA